MKPVTDIDSEPFWQGLAAGRLMIQRCPTTGRHQWYPRGHSIHDPRATPEWVEASGRGEVFSFTVIHRGNTRRPPYNCALIRLEEGVLMLSSLRGVEEDEMAIGMKVAVDFETFDEDLRLPVFRPAAAELTEIRG